MPIPLNLTQLFANNAVSLLTAAISETDTSVTVMTGHGAAFPQPTGDGSDYFLITLEDQAATYREIIKVTGRVGDTLTFDLTDRGQEGTTIRAWPSAIGNETLVDHRVTAETLRRAMRKPLPSASSGQVLFNQPVTILPPSGGKTVIVLQTPYQAGSTALFIGGLRQKLEIDYLETSPTQLTLEGELTQAMVNEGQHVTLDFIAA